MNPLSIKIIDDDIEYCGFMEEVLSSESCSISIENELDCLRSIVSPDTSIDLVLLDIYFPTGTSLDHMEIVEQKFPNAEIIMLTVSEHYLDLIRAIKQGAVGYFLKTNNQNQIIEAIKTFQSNGAFISPYMAKKLIHAIQGRSTNVENLQRLTKKEIEVLKMLSFGYTYEEAAKALNISINGVRARIKSVYKKLNVKNKTEAINIYLNKMY